MARIISGVISWQDDPLYSARTPIQEIHTTEIQEYLDKITEELDYHKSLQTYEAHASVNIAESGFISPELVQEILGLDDKIDALIEKAKNRLPAGIIVIWNGLTSDVPEGWHWCNGEDTTPDTRGRFVVCGYPGSNKYPLHTYGGAKSAIVGNLPEHIHTFFNGFYAENYDVWNPWKTPYGLSAGDAGENDWDNSWAYFKDYTDYAGTDTSSTSIDANPFHIKKPYMMKMPTEIVNRTITIVQPAYGTITINNSTTSPLVVPDGTLLTAKLSLADRYYAKSFTIGGESRENPCIFVVDRDLVVTADVIEKVLKLTVQQNSISKTYVNDTYGTEFTFKYGTDVTLRTDSTEVWKAVGYTITTNGYTVKAASLRALMAMVYPEPEKPKKAYTPPFIVNSFDPVTANVSLGKQVSRQDTKTISIPENETVTLLVQASFWSNFYGSRNLDQKVTIYLKLDNDTIATKYITYREAEEYAVQVINQDIPLTAGDHKLTLQVIAKSADANLDVTLTDSEITVTHTGKTIESEEV